MIEHSIKDYFDALFMTGFDKSGQIFICSKAGIKLFIISCLVSVTDTFEEWSDVQCSTSNFFDMADPWKVSIQAMYWFCVIILFWSTSQT